MSFSCSVCSKAYSRKRLLRLHVARQHTKKDEWTHKCEKCGKVYADAEILGRHLKSHLVQISCPEESCEQKFNSISAMHKHRRKFHLKIESPVPKKKEYACDQCDASFAKHHLLAQHTFVHTGVLPFPCSKCDKSFRTLSHRNRHEKIHDGYSCQQCTQKFDTWSKLQTHIKTAHPRIFKCLHCDKVFSLACRLKEHLSVHDEKRQVFKCKTCGKTFVKKSNLKTHFKIHHLKKKLFKCQVENCLKEFGYKHTLEKHMKIHQSGYVKNLKRTGKEKISLISRITGINPCNKNKMFLL